LRARLAGSWVAVRVSRRHASVRRAGRTRGGPGLRDLLRLTGSSARRGEPAFAIELGESPGLARLVWDVVESVGVVGTQVAEGEHSDYDDQHDDSHEDNQDRLDHLTIPLLWQYAALATTARPPARAFPLGARTLGSERRLFNVPEQRLCRTLYALSRNSGTLRVSADYLHMAFHSESIEAITLMCQF